jgi:hypothetical protein
MVWCGLDGKKKWIGAVCVLGDDFWFGAVWILVYRCVVSAGIGVREGMKDMIFTGLASSFTFSPLDLPITIPEI